MVDAHLQLVQLAVFGDYDAAELRVATIDFALNRVGEDGVREGRERLQLRACFFEERLELHRRPLQDHVRLRFPHQCIVCHRGQSIRSRWHRAVPVFPVFASPHTLPMLQNVRRLRRSAKVARTGLRIYLGYKRTQRRVRKLDPESAAAAWEAQHERSAERLYRMAIQLKGLYIKTGQFIGTRTDIVPGPYSAWLSKLQDQVPPHPYPVVERTIEHELGKPMDQLFASFEHEALGSASLAQVHRATLPDGREVVAKVQYPEVAGLVRLDVRNLKTIVGLVARREPNFDFRAIVNEISSQVPLELDFEREAEMTTRIRENLRDIPGIVIPEVVPGYVAGRVLVTEFIPGVRLLDKEAREALHPDPVALAQTIANAYGHQIMVDGLFQADPHPGNILVLPDGKAALLDFGLTKDLPKAARLGFARLVMAASNRDGHAIVAAFRELGVKTKSEAPEDVLPLMQLFFDARPAGEATGGFGSRRGAIRANPIEAIPGDLVLLGRVIGLLRGVCASLGTPLSPMQMLRPYAERALNQPVEGPGSAPSAS